MKAENIELKVDLGSKSEISAIEDSTLEFKIKSYRWLVVAIQKAIMKELEKLRE